MLGSPFNSQFGNNTGYIYIYKRMNGEFTFTQLASIYNPNFAINGMFGWSVSINSHGTIAVGAPGDRAKKGSVYIFKTSSPTQWAYVATLEPDGASSAPSTEGNFGWDVVINEE